MKVLVIGDSCVDKFIYCNINGLCPEAPVPILKPLYTTTNPGMAGNVVNNLKVLGAEVDFITNKINIYKTRYVDDKSGQMIMRLDENDSCDSYDGEVFNETKYDAIIISDYNKGFLSKEDILSIIEYSECPVFLDTKKIVGDWCKDIKFLKINTIEYSNNKQILEKMPNLLDKTIITKGPKGCKYKGKIYPTKKVPIKDVSGAGDTFIAALVYEYIKTKDIIKAINFAQKCTTIVVQKPGVATI